MAPRGAGAPRLPVANARGTRTARGAVRSARYAIPVLAQHPAADHGAPADRAPGAARRSRRARRGADGARAGHRGRHGSPPPRGGGGGREGTAGGRGGGGADGAHSGGRDAIRVAVVGGDYASAFGVAEVDGPWPYPRDEATVVRGPAGICWGAAFADGRFLIIADVPLDRAAGPPERDDLQHL